ncbi:DNA damage-induced apoptosis suppressor protein [Sardina pilchardus]|uniref:DNA damage-induced apoptosis suppressor protein n=1 Tax=Sardina pilchardus TaxID=27697 RepID=UPI002E0E863E
MSKIAFFRCTILSIQDTSILYPCCLNCFSRVDLTSGSNGQISRWICIKCGRDTESAGYRYRLSLRVSKDCHVLGVTVFGSCLDSFFGVPAGQFHRYLDASKESRGVQMTEGLLRRSLDDCFVGRCVLLGIKLPGNIGDHRPPGRLQSPVQWPSAERGTSEQYIASKIALPGEGVFGCTVVQYFQSLLRVCGPSEGSCSQEASRDSDQSSYHDYSQLCSGGSYLNLSEAANASFPLPLLRSPGLSSASVDSPEPSVSGDLGETSRTDISDVSAAVATCSCCEGRHGQKCQGSVSQESGYSETYRDKEPTGTFSPTSCIPVRSSVGSTSQSFFLDELLAYSFTGQDKLLAESLSCPSGPRSLANQNLVPARESSYEADSLEPACSFDSPTDTATTPEHLIYEDAEEEYNYSAELFDVSVGLDRHDFQRSEQVGRRPRTSVALRSMKSLLAPVSQSTPVCGRRVPGKGRVCKEAWESGSRTDGQTDRCVGDDRCCVAALATGLPTEDADWSKDLFVD